MDEIFPYSVIDKFEPHMVAKASTILSGVYCANKTVFTPENLADERQLEENFFNETSAILSRINEATGIVIDEADAYARAIFKYRQSMLMPSTNLRVSDTENIPPFMTLMATGASAINNALILIAEINEFTKQHPDLCNLVAHHLTIFLNKNHEV